MIPEIVLAAFIMVHTVDGREAAVNVDQITSVVSGSDEEGKKLLTDRVHCVVGMSNGRFLSVLEDCPEIVRKLEEGR